MTSGLLLQLRGAGGCRRWALIGNLHLNSIVMKPMLEFTNFPPRAEERPRKRRRRVVKTPKVVKVRCVSIAAQGRQCQLHPCLETESQIRKGELEIEIGAKWVNIVINSGIDHRYYELTICSSIDDLTDT